MRRYPNSPYAELRFLRAQPDGFCARPVLTQTGSYLLGDTPLQIAALEQAATKLGIVHETVALTAVLNQWPRLAGICASGGVYFPKDGVIDIHALLRGYIQGARQAGHSLVTQCEVHDFTPKDRGAVVATSKGNIETKCVVIAGGAWAGILGRCAGSKHCNFTAMQRHLFVTDWVGNVDRSAPFVWHLGKGEFYVRPFRDQQRQDAYLLSGCDDTIVSPVDAQVATGATTRLETHLKAVAPNLAETHVARSWACLRTFSSNGSPVIAWDQDVPWLFWVAGLGGHGVTASHAIGMDAAQRILTRIR